MSGGNATDDADFITMADLSSYLDIHKWTRLRLTDIITDLDARFTVSDVSGLYPCVLVKDYAMYVYIGATVSQPVDLTNHIIFKLPEYLKLRFDCNVAVYHTDTGATKLGLTITQAGNVRCDGHIEKGFNALGFVPGLTTKYST